MEFDFDQQDEAFRSELRAFLDEHWDASMAGDRDAHHEMQRRLGAHGWLTVAWPREYGGRGASPLQQLIFKEETARAGVDVDYSGTTLIGPVLMLYGTDEQKREHLPSIARAERRWAQGFSEPNAGSDLASLQTRAVRAGDDYVVDGQKIWSSYAHESDWAHVLVRTDPDAPKHRGISYLLVDLRTPGITVMPIEQMNGNAEFSQIFLEDVHVPARNLVGEENRGWYHATATLNFERSGVERNLQVLDDLRRARAFLASAEGRALTSSRPGVWRQRVADVHVEAEVGRLLARRVAWLQGQGQVPSSESAMSKVWNSELQQHNSETMINVMGLAGALWPGEPRAPMAGHWAFRYLDARRRTIGGGTSEIQRNLIAGRGLGLPRG